MTARRARLLRGLLTASLATFVAAMFHLASGGTAPSLLAVVLTMAFALPLCMTLAGRRVAAWRQLLAVGASQFLFHLLFTLGQGSAQLAPGTPAGHLHAGMTIAFTTGDPTAASLAAAGHTMWLGHLLAAFVTVAALRHGDAALRALARLAALTLARMAPLVATSEPRGCRLPHSAAAPRRIRRELRHAALRHRGPPTV